MPTKCQATGNFRIHRRDQENEVSVEISSDERTQSIEVAHHHDDEGEGGFIPPSHYDTFMDEKRARSEETNTSAYVHQA